jgi:hypothetical protein
MFMYMGFCGPKMSITTLTLFSAEIKNDVATPLLPLLCLHGMNKYNFTPFIFFKKEDYEQSW